MHSSTAMGMVLLRLVLKVHGLIVLAEAPANDFETVLCIKHGNLQHDISTFVQSNEQAAMRRSRLGCQHLRLTLSM